MSGVYEIAFGCILIFFIEPLLALMNMLQEPLNYPIFAHVAGLLAICFGILLCCSYTDPERYLIIAVVSIGLRFALQVILIYDMFLLPFMAGALVSFGLIDLGLAILTLVAIKLKNS